MKERLALYEAEVSRLETVRDQFVRRRPLYDRGFLALILGGIACFAFGKFAGLWGTISASVVGLSGFGMVRRRVAELTSEVNALRQEIARMHAGPGAAQ